VDGLVHVSELSWKHVDHPSEIVSVSQEVDVEVLDVDLDRERVSLSLKATQEDPWREFERKHQTGEIIAGQVTKLVPFGAFVRVGDGIEGLVHISELSDQHVESPEQIVQVGEQVRVKVVDVDVPRRRISLSIRRVAEEPEVVPEPEIQAESTEAISGDLAPEPSAETRRALDEGEPQGDESSREVFEAALEPEETAPEEAAMRVAPEPEPEPQPTEGEEGEDVSLESIVEELKRREGRS
jgi:small subunit ribosomal protein S1